MPEYKDLHDEKEDKRIRIIGNEAMKGKVVSFLTDDEHGKMERYLTKLFIEFSELELVERGNGPTPGVVWAKVRRKP